MGDILTVRKEVYFDSREQIERFEECAKNMGFKSFSAFVRYCLAKVSDMDMKRDLDIDDKLDLIIEKLDGLSVVSENQHNELVDVFSSLKGELSSTYSQSDVKYLLEQLMDIFEQDVNKWWSIDELVQKLEIKDDNYMISVLRDIIMEPNPWFDNDIERRGERFRVRREPKGIIPDGPVELIG